MGRFTLDQWLKLPTGVVVLLVVFMALFMFWGAEQLERIFGGKDPKAAPKWRYAAAAGLVGVAVIGMVIGQPTASDRWARIAPEREAQLANREVQIHPGELLDLLHNNAVRVVMLDVRSESDYNAFHIQDAQHVPPKDAEIRVRAANALKLMLGAEKSIPVITERALSQEKDSER